MDGYVGVLEIGKDMLYMLLDPETREDKELPVLEHDYCHVARLGNSLTLARCADDRWSAVRVGTKEERKTGMYPSFLDDVCYWSEYDGKKIDIVQDGKKIGERPGADCAAFFLFKDKLFDFSGYGVYETLANKKILESSVNEIVPVSTGVYVAQSRSIFLRSDIVGSGRVLNLPQSQDALEPYNLCPFGQTLYFKSGLDLGEGEDSRSGIGQFKYYFPDKSLEVMLDTDKWAPWKKDKSGFYPIDFAESNMFWAPITAREVEQLKLLEYKRPG